MVEPYNVFSGNVATRRRRLWFEGDEEGKPNVGWVWAKRDADAEGLERYFEDGDEGVRKWGYVMWDNARLKRWGVLLAREEESRRRGRWVCTEITRESGRVLPSWVWVDDGEGTAGSY